MSSDLLFAILPRLGKEPIKRDMGKIKKVSKEASLRSLNDEEKQLNAEQIAVRQKAERKPQPDESEHNYTDANGQRHIDDFA